MRMFVGSPSMRKAWLQSEEPQTEAPMKRFMRVVSVLRVVVELTALCMSLVTLF